MTTTFKVTFTATTVEGGSSFKATTVLKDNEVLDISRCALLQLFKKENTIEDDNAFFETFLTCVSRAGLELRTTNGLCAYYHEAKCSSYSLYNGQIARIPTNACIWLKGESVYAPNRFFIGMLEKSGVWVTVEEQ